MPLNFDIAPEYSLLTRLAISPTSRFACAAFKSSANAANAGSSGSACAVPVRQRRMGAVEPAEGLLVHHALEGHHEQREQEGDDDEQEQRQDQRHRLQLARPLRAGQPHLERYAVDGEKRGGLRDGHAIEIAFGPRDRRRAIGPAPSVCSGYWASQALKRLVSSSLLSAQNTRSVDNRRLHVVRIGRQRRRDRRIDQRDRIDMCVGA